MSKAKYRKPRAARRAPLHTKTIRWNGLEAAYDDEEQQLLAPFVDAAKAGDEIARRELEVFHELKALFPGGRLVA